MYDLEPVLAKQAYLYHRHPVCDCPNELLTFTNEPTIAEMSLFNENKGPCVMINVYEIRKYLRDCSFSFIHMFSYPYIQGFPLYF